MFNNVEEKLKGFAVVNFICIIIIAVFFFFAFILEFWDEGFLIAVLSLITYCAVVYCLFASCWFMYAFAEITESVKETNKALQLTFERNISAAEEKHKKEAEAAAEAARRASEEKKAAEAAEKAARKSVSMIIGKLMPKKRRRFLQREQRRKMPLILSAVLRQRNVQSSKT